MVPASGSFLPLAKRGFVVLAAVAIAFLSSCASIQAGTRQAEEGDGLRLLDSEADFTRLGIDRHVVAPWEDGRRSPSDGKHFEWWYFDGLLDDGTVVVAWIGDNWPYGLSARAVSLEVTPPGGQTKRWFGSFREAGSFAAERAAARVGPHSFSGDLKDYRVVVDPAATGGLGIDLRLHATVAAWRPSSGIVADGDSFFAWLAAVPDGEVSGTLTVDGGVRDVRGSGYHDHNWGNISPALLMDSWWWGRARVGDRTVIASWLRATGERGGGSAPLLFVGSPRGLEKEAWSLDGLQVAEGGPSVHPDPAHPKPIPSFVSYATADGFKAVFPVSERMVTSADLLAGQPWGLAVVAGMMGIKPWYTRFVSPVSLAVPGEEVALGEGTLEYFEFR